MTASTSDGCSGAAVFRKSYLTGSRPDIRVPVKEVVLTSGDAFTLYDTSGRIRQGPAPLNLAVPEYTFLSDTRVKIGPKFGFVGGASSG